MSDDLIILGGMQAPIQMDRDLFTQYKDVQERKI